MNHPAHVHFFKNFIWEMEKRGHEFFISSRDKEIALHLLESYGFKYFNRGAGYSGLLGKGLGMLEMDAKLYRVAKKFNPDLFLGLHNTYIAHLGKLLRKPSITFTDTEHARLASLLTMPFTDAICTPSCFTKDFGKKHVRYNGYHELAYLHPNYFTPDPTVFDDLEISKNEPFFIVRFVSWGASHDVGEKGISLAGKRKLVDLLSDHGKVYITSEENLPKEFEQFRLPVPPERIHDLLAYANLYFGESPTMTTESSVLGTPAICVNSWACRCGNFIDLKKHMLLNCFHPSEFPAAITCVEELLSRVNLKGVWNKRRENLLKGKIDVTGWMIEYIQDYLERSVYS